MDKSVIIDVQDIGKNYQTQHAVNNVSFQVKKGEIFGLLGPNGAGKSTLMSLLSCALKPSYGTAKIDSLDIVSQPKRVREIIGLVPQDLALYQNLSAYENLLFYGRIYRLKGKKLKERINLALEVAQLQDHAKKIVKKYSGGMKRRLNLAVSLLSDPKVLFLDEPTVGIDPQSRNHIFDSILKLSNQGMTCIYTTHYMEEAEHLCSRVAIYDKGKILSIDTPQNLIEALGKNEITVKLSDLDNDLINTLKDFNVIKKFTTNDNQITIFAESITPVINIIQSYSNKTGFQILQIDSKNTNLETVFLNLTGKSLRD